MRSLIVLTVLMIIPLILFFIEYKLAKQQSKLAIILPTVVLCFAIIMPIIAITSIIMFVIYFVVKYLEKEISNFKPGQMIYDYLTFVLKQVNQLDESEVLSQKWIDRKSVV